MHVLPESKVTVVDLPGNKDSRSEIEVMMVSYILNSCFHFSKKAKFMLVITDMAFNSINGT